MRFAGHTDCEVCDEEEAKDLARRDREVVRAFIATVKEHVGENPGGDMNWYGRFYIAAMEFSAEDEDDDETTT